VRHYKKCREESLPSKLSKKSLKKKTAVLGQKCLVKEELNALKIKKGASKNDAPQL